MTTTLLAYIPSPAQGVWHLGPLPIRAYALCIITGIIAALIIGDRRWVDRGGEPGVIYDIALWAVPFGLVGGRLYHVMTDWKTYFSEGGAGVVGALRVWDGGLGIWGAVALGAVGAWIGCRRRGIPLPAFGDAVAPGVVLAQAIGRLGNYFNQELYGRPTNVPWGLEIFERRDASGALDTLNGVSTGQLVAVVHPTFLYELIWNVLVFAFLLWADRRFRMGHGRLFALYVAAYCIGRFGVELMRDDFATHIAGIRVNSFTSTFVFIGAVVYMMVAPKGREAPASLGGLREDEEAADESRLDEVGKELIVVASTSGIVAAATIAGAEDESSEHHGGEIADEADAAETEADETQELDPEAAQVEPEAEAEVPEAEAGPEAGAEAETASDAESEAAAVEGEAESKGDADSDSHAEPEADAEAEAQVETESDVESEADAEPKTEAQPAAESVAESAVEGAAEPEGELDSDAEPEADAEAKTEAEPESAAVEDASESEDESDSDTQPEADAEAKTEAEPAAVAGEVEPEPEADVAEPTEAQDVDEPAAEVDEPESAANEPAAVEDSAGESTDPEKSEVDEPKAEEPKAESRPLPAWEPMAPRRRWWQRQR
ncbi:prolipoprotein diacylglyceryl transferase [Mycobacterium sp. MAA66]|uniref:prolipoprotein diacylglyceryl transferase n=1 Tax=Mycobacterium sp. MAA66 TaxID=3156297 RepID=UPI0035148BD4